MIWKPIGHSVTGTSHTAIGKGCEDALQYSITTDAHGQEVLIACASDGAGSAAHAAQASAFTTSAIISALSALVTAGQEIDEAAVYAVVESVYVGLAEQAAGLQVELNEFSCTLLACCISASRAVFFQIGDGAIVRNDGSGFYTAVWWPHNGEYQNSTAFLIDDITLRDLRIAVIDEPVHEVAIFTDGLQMLALSFESGSVHQPFFTDMFRFLRMADDENKIAVLNGKLAAYLDSRQINDRTDDDKTLFMATRLPS
jgi:hypothetical protein